MNENNKKDKSEKREKLLFFFKVFFFIIIILFIIVLIGKIGGINAGDIFLLVFILGIIGIVWAILYSPIRKLIVKPKPHEYYIQKHVEFANEQNQPIGGTIRNGKLEQFPKYDISFLLGNHHFLRCEDPSTKTTTCKFFSVRDGVPTGEIKYNKLNLDPEKAIGLASNIIEMIETGATKKNIKVTTPDIMKVLDDENKG